MKRLIIIILALVICIPTVQARKKSAKSGTIKDNVYTDSEHGFMFTLPENWVPKLQKQKKDLRLILNQKDFEIPPELMPYPTLTEVPELKVLIIEQPYPAQAFVDSIVKYEYSSDAKKEVFKDILALEEKVIFDGLTPDKKMKKKIDEKWGYQWEGSAHFTKKLGMGDEIPRTHAVGIYAVKNGDKTLVFLLTCENTFFNKIFKEITTMVDSTKWPDKK